MSDAKSPFQSHSEGSFASLFATAIEPYQKRIERLDQSNKLLRKRVEELEIKFTEVRRKTSEVKKAVSQKAPNMKTSERFKETHPSYSDIIEHLRDTYKNVNAVPKEKIISKQNITRDLLRTELAMLFDTRLLSPSFFPDLTLYRTLRSAGLNGTPKQVTLLVEGKDVLFSIFLIDRKA